MNKVVGPARPAPPGPARLPRRRGAGRRGAGGGSVELPDPTGQRLRLGLRSRTTPARRATRCSAAPSTPAATPARRTRSSAAGGRPTTPPSAAARRATTSTATPTGTALQCHCNTTTCDQRRVACNQFRYGQCNTQIPYSNTGPVLCRVVSCTPPWVQYGATCSSTSATDNNTATHTAPC